jgi:hypothetical protein
MSSFSFSAGSRDHPIQARLSAKPVILSSACSNVYESETNSETFLGGILVEISGLPYDRCPSTSFISGRLLRCQDAFAKKGVGEGHDPSFMTTQFADHLSSRASTPQRPSSEFMILSEPRTSASAWQRFSRGSCSLGGEI